MADSSTTLDVRSRQADGSRAARRLRRSGRVPGVIYGGDAESVARLRLSGALRRTLASAGAVVDLDHRRR